MLSKTQIYRVAIDVVSASSACQSMTQACFGRQCSLGDSRMNIRVVTLICSFLIIVFMFSVRVHCLTTRVMFDLPGGSKEHECESSKFD